ncbi:hypothetical protein [Anaeromusa acidaminophila]|uniref:hypothetical protein n=1 Tax=Anaeromusa acidaminophila TaxID=81464 RepID=UPI00036E7FB0|nr:hypothetical protein [Anaeromusa acidaminophila]
MSEPKDEKRKKSTGCGCVLLIIIVLSAFLSWGINHEKTAPDIKIDAFVSSQMYVQQNLKAPSTAKFASVAESSIQKINDSQYQVTSFVDSQNDFGAMIRTKYIVVMERIEDKWFLVKLDFDK